MRRLLNRLLAIALPADERDALTGDLAEEYTARIEPARGRWRADLWYAGQVLTACAYGIRGRRREPRRIMSWLPALGRDVRFAARGLRRTPGFTLLAVVSLAVGIGANTAIFGLLYDVLLQPLPVPHPDRLVSFERVSPGGRDDGFSQAEARALGGAADLVTLATHRDVDNIRVDINGGQRYVSPMFVDGALFETLGLRPVAGRFISVNDDLAGARVVVVSERFWERYSGTREPAVGRKLTIGGQPFTIIGVAPGAFRGLDYPGYFTIALPMAAAPLLGLPDFEHQRERAVSLIGRLSDRASAPAALAAADALFQRCCAAGELGVPSEVRETSRLAFVDMSRGIGGGKDDFRPDVRSVLTAFMAAVVLVLIIACANVGNLLLIRGSGRAREIALRLSIGASPARVIRELLVEGVLLAALGGGAGFALAAWGRSVITNGVPASQGVVADVVQFQPKPPVVFFTLLMIVVSVLLAAVVPALRVARVDLMSAIKAGSQPGRRAGGYLIERLGVIAQVALALLLVSAASLLVATLDRLSAVDIGLAPDRLVLASVETRGTSLEPGGIVPVHAQILQRVRALPGVDRAAMSSYMPFYGGRRSTGPVTLLGDASPAAPVEGVTREAITPDLFATTGITLIAGREFTPTDDAAAPRVVVVSQRLARALGVEREAVGRRVQLGTGVDRTATIVGVARDVRLTDLRGAPDAIVYAPATQAGPWPFFQLTVRTSGPPADVAARLATAIDAAAPGIQVRRISTMDVEIRTSLVRERFAASLAALFGVLALGLSALGLYGVVAHQVARRMNEFGVRTALGARGGDLLRLVMRGSFSLVAIGIVLGLPLALLAGRAIAPELYGVRSHEPVLFMASVAVLLAAALLAVVVPARRAARVDPLSALRAL